MDIHFSHDSLNGDDQLVDDGYHTCVEGNGKRSARRVQGGGQFVSTGHWFGAQLRDQLAQAYFVHRVAYAEDG